MAKVLSVLSPKRTQLRGVTRPNASTVESVHVEKMAMIGNVTPRSPTPAITSPAV